MRPSSYLCILICALFIGLVSYPAMADLKKAQWQDVENVDALTKKYPFFNAPINNAIEETEGGDSAISISYARVELTPEKNLFLLQIYHSLYCGAVSGCTTIAYLEDTKAKKVSKVYNVQLPGDVYGGLCENNPVMVAQLPEPGGSIDTQGYRTFPMGADGKLHLGQFFPTLEAVDTCAPVSQDD